MRTLIIGDLHLSADRPDITQAFINFLDHLPADTESLYIVGDLFEVWVGDDIAEPFALDVARHIKSVSEKLPVYFIHGNRDFMLGKQFAKLAGMQLLPEVFLTELYGKQTVILHGDSLCTLDKAYQRFRRFRSVPLFRWIYSKLPKSKRLQIAADLRGKSKRDNKSKSYEIMDVEPSAVVELLDSTGAVQMIHGHTHRPKLHSLENHRSRLVVGDWYTQGSVLTLTPEGAELSTLSLR
ncbi:UDP-2,3-diacylglucosamine diphosphatase [Shewanella submarina]|uniref:UDP-2,3-diacylglucosamine hydrolase n=1 Tax=Shewanella submarina TaxID=2016376 RepID=A0ABV7GFS4_9GAMM|nr:UDP-2,3-diacylglucosamine diphosphatase [Shewanella submarina]MCL1036708.1 UDP-2,3-diacylglucosamine diphosphatase [Shewanella submarina]